MLDPTQYGFVFVHIETTGNSLQDHYPVELGAAFCDYKLNPVDTTNHIVRPPDNFFEGNLTKGRSDVRWAPIAVEAYKRHGLPAGTVYEYGIAPSDVVDDVLWRIKKHYRDGEKLAMLSDNAQFHGAFFRKMLASKGEDVAALNPFSYIWDITPVMLGHSIRRVECQHSSVTKALQNVRYLDRCWWEDGYFKMFELNT